MPRNYSMSHVRENSLPGEALLVAAFLRQKIADASRVSGVHPMDRDNARAFLLDLDAVSFWAHLLGADGAVVQARLLRAAGLKQEADAL